MHKLQSHAMKLGVVLTALALAGCTGPVREYAEQPGLYQVELYPPNGPSQSVAIRQAAAFCGLALPINAQQASAVAAQMQMRYNTGYLTRTVLEFRCP